MTLTPRYAAFVAAWQRSSTLSEAAASSGMASADARFLAGHLRRKGVALKRFRNNQPRADYAALARLAPVQLVAATWGLLLPPLKATGAGTRITTQGATT